MNSWTGCMQLLVAECLIKPTKLLPAWPKNCILLCQAQAICSPIVALATAVATALTVMVAMLSAAALASARPVPPPAGSSCG